MKKRIVAFVLTLTMLLSLCTTFAYAGMIDLTDWRTKASTGIGWVAGAMADAVARQPEAERKIETSFYIMAAALALMPWTAIPDDEMLVLDSESGRSKWGLAATGASAMDAIARQPEVAGKIQTAMIYVIIATALNPKASDGLGYAGGAMMDAMARQPEAAEKLQNKAWPAVAIASALMPWANIGLGKSGASMMDAVARQPEAAGKIIKNYVISAAITAVGGIVETIEQRVLTNRTAEAN